MGHVTESIWDGKGTIIPMAEVSHIEKLVDAGKSTGRIWVIFKHSKWNQETQCFEPNVFLDSTYNSRGFLSAWCRYRTELEHDSLIDVS